jgi:hypothetical protein
VAAIAGLAGRDSVVQHLRRRGRFSCPDELGGTQSIYWSVAIYVLIHGPALTHRIGISSPRSSTREDAMSLLSTPPCGDNIAGRALGWAGAGAVRLRGRGSVLRRALGVTELMGPAAPVTNAARPASIDPVMPARRRHRAAAAAVRRPMR